MYTIFKKKGKDTLLKSQRTSSKCFSLMLLLNSPILVWHTSVMYPYLLILSSIWLTFMCFYVNTLKFCRYKLLMYLYSWKHNYINIVIWLAILAQYTSTEESSSIVSIITTMAITTSIINIISSRIIIISSIVTVV